MGAVAVALEGPNERVGGTRGPHAVELGGVPGLLERHLRYADRVRRRARGGVDEAVRVDRVVPK